MLGGRPGETVTLHPGEHARRLEQHGRHRGHAAADEVKPQRGGDDGDEVQIAEGRRGFAVDAAAEQRDGEEPGGQCDDVSHAIASAR